MEVYFYCSYAHSASGFFMTRLNGAALEPVCQGQIPDMVFDFFSYARFRFLWRDLAQPVKNLWSKPRPEAGFLGLRELHGTLSDGRSCAMNLVITADQEELTALRRVALQILGDYEGFERRLAGWMSVGGPCGYEIDGARFLAWMADCAGRSKVKRYCDGNSAPGLLLSYVCETTNPRLEPQLVHLAACTQPWETTREYFGVGPLWTMRPEGVLSVEEFDNAFLGHGELWGLYNE